MYAWAGTRPPSRGADRREHCGSHRRGGLSRLPSLRVPARARVARDLPGQPRHRVADEHQAPARGPVRVPLPQLRGLHRRGRAGGRGVPPGQPRQPGRLPAAAAAHAQGRFLRHPQRAGPGQVQARPVSAGVDVRGLRRPGGAPPARGVLGQREPGRAARRLRRGQALLRGADDGLPPPAGRGHAHRAHLQHLRAADAPARRARDPQLHPPGAGGQADHDLRRRQPDAVVLLRGRPDRGHLPAGDERLTTCR